MGQAIWGRVSATAAWRNGARHPDVCAVLLLGVVALVPRVILLLRAPAFVTNDSLSYLLPGFDLATGLGFDPPFKRPPGYPDFVAGALWFFGQQDLRGLLLLQHLGGLATVGLTYLLGRLLWGRAAGWLAGLLLALSGPLVITEHYVMSEALFGVLLLATILAAVTALRGRRLGLLALAGVLLGGAALTRPVAQLLLPVLALLALATWPRWRPSLVALGLLAACYLLVVLPWMARNSAVQHSFTLAGGLGEGLAVRTIRLDQDFDFRAPPGPDSLRREREIYREEARQGSVYALAARLRNELGLSPLEADRAMRDIALGAIRQKPLYYVGGSIDMFLKMFAGRPVRLRQDWQPWRGIAWEDRVQHLLPSPPPGQDSQLEVAQAAVSLYDPARWWPLLAALFVVGCGAAARRPDRVAALLPATAAIGPLLISAFLVGIEWRYRYPLDPLIDVTVAGGALALIHAAGGRLAHTVAPARFGWSAAKPEAMSSPVSTAAAHGGTPVRRAPS